MSALQVSAHAGREGMDAIRSEWTDLLARVPSRNPFLSYEWSRSCLEDPEGATPHLLTVRDAGRLVGLASLARRTVRRRGITAREIGFLVCRETAYADVLADPMRRADVINAMFRHLHGAERATWDLLSLGPWSEDAPTLATARQWLQSNRAAWTEATRSLVPITRMDGDWDAFWNTRSYLFRKSRRGVLNRMKRVGGITIECHRVDEQGTALRDVFRVSDRSWKRTEGKAITSRPESIRFFEALTAAAGDRGWLLLWILRRDGAPIATEYDLVEGDTVYAIRADYDQADHAHSPGAYLEYHLMQRLCADGCSAYHAGPGTDAYKLRWTEERRRTLELIAYNRTTPAGLALRGAEGLVTILKKARSRVRPEPPAAEESS